MSPNNQDMYRMQQDALRRVWQMQEQARRSVENQTPEPESKQGSARQQSSQKESNPQKKRENPNFLLYGKNQNILMANGPRYMKMKQILIQKATGQNLLD